MTTINGDVSGKVCVAEVGGDVPLAREGAGQRTGMRWVEASTSSYGLAKIVPVVAAGMSGASVWSQLAVLSG